MKQLSLGIKRVSMDVCPTLWPGSSQRSDKFLRYSLNALRIDNCELRASTVERLSFNSGNAKWMQAFLGTAGVKRAVVLVEMQFLRHAQATHG